MLQVLNLKWASVTVYVPFQMLKSYSYCWQFYQLSPKNYCFKHLHCTISAFKELLVYLISVSYS